MPVMRKPTPTRELYRWWNDAIDGKRPPIHEDDPHCGFFKRRFVRGGPWVPVEFFCDRLVIGGELAAPETIVARVRGKIEPAERHWLSCCTHAIPHQEFAYLEELMKHSQRYEPDLPQATPHKAIDWNTVKF